MDKLFTQPNCKYCEVVKKALEKKGILSDFNIIDVSTADGYVEALLYDVMSTPAVVTVVDGREVVLRSAEEIIAHYT
jgi:predicted thioredoxin/glutaredoxin